MIRHLFAPSVIIITLVWAFLWGSYMPLTILSGIAIAWFFRWRFPLPPMFWPGRFRPIGFLILVVRLIWDLVVSSWRIVLLTIPRKIHLEPGIVRVDIVTDVDLYQVQVAEMISLVPGTVVVEVVRSPRCLYLHVVHMDEAHDVDAIRAMALRVERQVLGAFGSDEERRVFNELHGRPRRKERLAQSGQREVEE